MQRAWHTKVPDCDKLSGNGAEVLSGRYLCCGMEVQMMANHHSVFSRITSLRNTVLGVRKCGAYREIFFLSFSFIVRRGNTVYFLCYCEWMIRTYLGKNRVNFWVLRVKGSGLFFVSWWWVHRSLAQVEPDFTSKSVLPETVAPIEGASHWGR